MKERCTGDSSVSPVSEAGTFETGVFRRIVPLSTGADWRQASGGEIAFPESRGARQSGNGPG